MRTRRALPSSPATWSLQPHVYRSLWSDATTNLEEHRRSKSCEYSTSRNQECQPIFVDEGRRCASQTPADLQIMAADSYRANVRQ